MYRRMSCQGEQSAVRVGWAPILVICWGSRGEEPGSRAWHLGDPRPTPPMPTFLSSECHVHGRAAHLSHVGAV